jgi:hypothetical protein
VGCSGTRCEMRVPEGPSSRGWRDSEAGATDAASGPPTLTRVGGPAADVTPSGTMGSDWHGGRAGPSTLRYSGLQAARLRAWRVAGVTIWHVRSTRSAAACASSGPVRQAGPSVAVTRRTSGLRSRATGRAAVVNTAGAAGLAVLREGWKPGKVETHRGSMRRTTARTPRIRDAPRVFLRRGVPSSRHSTTNRRVKSSAALSTAHLDCLHGPDISAPRVCCAPRVIAKARSPSRRAGLSRGRQEPLRR